VIATISAALSGSSPSMKLTRFTNHRPVTSNRPRSTQSGQAGTIPKLPCSSSRTTTGMDLTSSAKPTVAMNSVAPNAAIGIVVCAAPASAMTAAAEISVVAITATPARYGVGIRSRIGLCQRDPQHQRPG
jgi:hypothetical protein